MSNKSEFSKIIKFFQNAVRQWARKNNQSKQGPPPDAAGLAQWVKDNEAPTANVGEVIYDYRRRLWDWINAGRPEAKTEKPPATMPAGWRPTDDDIQAGIDNQAGPESTD